MLSEPAESYVLDAATNWVMQTTLVNQDATGSGTCVGKFGFGASGVSTNTQFMTHLARKYSVRLASTGGAGSDTGFGNREISDSAFGSKQVSVAAFALPSLLALFVSLSTGGVRCA